VFSVKKLNIAVPNLTEFQQYLGRPRFSADAQARSPGAFARFYLHIYALKYIPAL